MQRPKTWQMIFCLDSFEGVSEMYEQICESCTQCRMPRALFDRGMKELVEDFQNDLDIDLNAIPAPDSPKEAMIFQVYMSAYDKAFVSGRKTVLDLNET
ncbi:hypothetical protein HNY73_016965 [Argiope bruennichi]|uniref:Uncharacterized protein n=1 Tax=Argiope bruennichi TaxID=94029 RepID=A0A8T0EKC8_ARGBR|nr:hypothetical protein HNY73_016965 [Argiope bruennichi]